MAKLTEYRRMSDGFRARLSKDEFDALGDGKADWQPYSEYVAAEQAKHDNARKAQLDHDGNLLPGGSKAKGK